MAYNRNYKKKSAQELQDEINQYMDHALDDIKKYVNKPEDVLELADFMANFYQYSPKNLKLIHHQFPHAKAVANAPTFSKQGFYINKGEKAIRIFVPTPIKHFILPDGTIKSLSEATSEEKRQIEQGILELKQTMRFKLAPVFDITQTNATAADFPKIFPNRRYEFDYTESTKATYLKQALMSLGDSIQVPVHDMQDSRFGHTELGASKGAYLEGTSGLGETKREIVLNPRFSVEEQIPTLIHELSHSSLQNREAMKTREVPLTSQLKEFQAELTSYIVCRHFGIDTSEEAIPYISSWIKNEDEIEDRITTLDEIHNLSRNFIQYVEKELEQLIPEVEMQFEVTEKKMNSETMILEEEKTKAKSVSIVELAEQNGFVLQKESRNQYRDTEHSSLVFIPSKNKFYYNKEGIQGDTITFAQKMLGIENFREAIQFINKGEYGSYEVKEVEVAPFVYKSLNEVTSFTKARSYLVNERKIDAELVDCLHEKGLIRQDKQNNILFLWNDKGNVVGCNEQGTIQTDKLPRGSWKKVQENSAHDKGFNFKNGLPKNLKFFESSIDCLSYVSLNKYQMKDTWYISMEGLKDVVVESYISEAREITKDHVESISLCVDNDKAGRNFVEKFSSLKLIQNGKLSIPIQAEYPTLPPEKIHETNKWDWSNEIIYQMEKKEKQKNKNLEHVMEL